MLTTLALVSALGLVPGQPGSLALTNVRSTYGLHGSTRPDNKLLPGDQVFLAFDIENVQTGSDGKVQYSIAMEVANGAGKVLFKQAPRDLTANNALGGTNLPAYANLQVGLDQPPGDYTVKVTVTDRGSKASKTLTSKFQVLPKGFGLVRLALTGDPEGFVPVPFPATGQTLWINFAAVGFGRQGDQPNLNVTMRVLDEKGKPTSAKPFVGAVSKDVPKNAVAVPMQFALELNRAGTFTVELKGTDKVSGKTATLTFPITVLKAK
jgi:hypothetical protein